MHELCELWGEDVVSLGKEGAPTPQPCLFNLCVRADQRRRGVGAELIRECEALSRAWKQRTLFLKVRADNDGAERLYARAGFESVAVREAANVPGWQERWKGETAGGLLLMRKRLGSPLEQAADALQLRPSAPPPAPGFSELNVTIGQVAAYGDPDAFGLVGIHMVPRERGLALHEHLIELLEAGSIRPVVGRTADHTALPAELERMERRETMGRTILDWTTAA